MRMPACLLLGITLVSDVSAAATNLLPNGDFSNAMNADGWTCVSMMGSWKWTSDDADAFSDSGSIELSASAFGDDDDGWYQGLEVCGSSCFDVRPGAAYEYGGGSRLLTLTGGSGSSFAMHLFCGTYAQHACDGAPTWLAGPAMSMSPDWSTSVTNGVIPSDAVSASCQIQAIADGTSAFGTGHFDNLYFTTDVILANGFD